MQSIKVLLILKTVGSKNLQAPIRRSGPYPEDEILRGQQDYSRAKDVILKDLKLLQAAKLQRF